MMHSILFRIDYQGLIDTDVFLETFTRKYSELFEGYETAFNNQIDLYITSFEEISESLSVPVKEIEKQVVHRFSKAKFGSDEVVFDISKYFTVLQVNCVNYQSIDPYLNFFSDFCSLIYSENKFLMVKRFGLRKIGTERFDNLEEIFKVFEGRYFNFEFDNEKLVSLRRELKDRLETPEKIQIEYRRGFEKGFLHYPDGNIQEKFQVTLDIDGILDQAAIEKLGFKENTASILSTINHQYLFDLFKMSVTLDFLKHNCKDE